MKSVLRSCVLLAAMVWSSTAGADALHLKFAFPNQDTDTSWVTTMKPFIARVNEQAAGKLVIDGYPNGALGKNLAQQPQLILSGVTDIGFVVPSISPGRFADTEVLELPRLFDTIREATLVHSAMAKASDFKSYSNFVVLAALNSDPFSIHTKAHIASLADLQGKKIRASSGIQSRMLADLGMASVFMGFPDVPEAIARGTLDGVAIQLVPLRDTNLTRLVTSHFFAGVGTTPISVLMNKAKFDSLPPDLQDLLRKAGDEMTQNYITQFEKADDDILKSLKADPGHSIIYPSAEDTKRLDAAAQKETDAWVKQDAARGDMLAKAQAALKTIRGK